jgi:rRNA-processing protein FCF1
VSWGDIAWSNMYSIEALMNTLEKKGLITKQEVLEELQKLKDGHEKRIMIELNMI